MTEPGNFSGDKGGKNNAILAAFTIALCPYSHLYIHIRHTTHINKMYKEVRMYVHAWEVGWNTHERITITCMSVR